jgi:hypothetical protein
MGRPKPIDLLSDAIDAARAALRDLDADEVSARVQRVRTSSARSLPPPLAASLVRELAADEFLRTKALEAWAGDRPPAGGPALASYAFLAREPGWEMVVVAESIALGERHGAATDRTGELERESLAAEVASLKEQLKRFRAEAAGTERELRDALEAERAPGRAARQGEQRVLDQLESERADRRQMEESLRARIESLEAETRRLKEEAHSARSDRAELAAIVEAGGGEALPTDPVGLARVLDDLAAFAMASAPAAAPVETEGVAVASGLDPFDASLRPDRAEAIDWLAGAGTGAVLVDGYNLGFALAGLEAERARAVAIEAAARLAASAPALEVTVVFDSSVDPIEADSSPTGRSGPVSVVFTEGEIADDAIVARACAGTSVVVITNDRDLRHRVEACGAITLWSDALVEWSRRR